MLVEDPSIAEYYLPSGTQWRRWSSTRNIVLPSGASTGHPTSQGIVGAGNPAVFARYIARGYFSLVALNFADTAALDQAIAADLRRHHYEPERIDLRGSRIPFEFRWFRDRRRPLHDIPAGHGHFSSRE
jgi:hypothetical protein